MELRDLGIHPQLASLLEKSKGSQAVHTPQRNVKNTESRSIPDDGCEDLPRNIDSFPFSRYVEENFRVGSQWGVLTAPLKNSIIKSVPEKDIKLATMMNKLILRYMMDTYMQGSNQKLFSDFIINMVLTNYDIRDEILAQIASLTWNNFADHQKNKLWSLLSNCLSCIIPSSSLHSYLLKYASDHGINDYPAHLQRKLLSMPPSRSLNESRLFPPSILEWKANHECGSMALEIHLPDDKSVLVEVNSWTTAEDAANRALEASLGTNVQGWSLVLEQQDGTMIEVSGYEYILDLFSHLELTPELETHPHEFIIYRSRSGSNPAFDPSEFLHSGKPGKKQPNSPRHQPPENDLGPSGGRLNPQVNSSYSSNFSYGPPNIRMSRGPQHEGLHSKDVNDLDSRMKGGGRMMGMGGYGMMQQPQMMPMMQQPMMMQQQPQMMMQPQMMPMQSMSMQQPMNMMQPQMNMPMHGGGMPSSIGMMPSGMDPMSQQQTMMQQQFMMMMKQQEEQQKEIKKLLKKQDKKSNRRDSSSEDERMENKWKKESRRKKSSRRRDRSSSDEASPPRRHVSTKGKAGIATATYLHRKSSSGKESSKFRVSPRPRELEDEEDEEKYDIPQGSVRMSFSEKKKFFAAKAMAESQPSYKKPQKPKKIVLPKVEDEPQSKFSDPESAREEPKPTPAWKKKPSPLIPKKIPEKDPRKEALRILAVNQKTETAKKPPPPEPPTIEELALLSRQRREAARKQQSATSPSPEPEPELTPPVRPIGKLRPERIAVIEEQKPKKPTPKPVKLSTPPVSPASTPEHRERDPSPPPVSALAAALAAKKRQEQEQERMTSVFMEDRYDEEPPVLPPRPESPEDIPYSPPGMMTDASTRTVKHSVRNSVQFRYVNVGWKLRARKEIFHAGETIKDVAMAALLFKQVAKDAFGTNPRIVPADREDFRGKLKNSINNKVEAKSQKSILENVKENWNTYFTQIFRIKIRDISSELPKFLYKANAIGVGQTGIHFLTLTGSPDWRPHTYNFIAVSQVQEISGILELDIQGLKMSLMCRKANQLKKVILPYLIQQPRSPVSPSVVLMTHGDEPSGESAFPDNHEQVTQESIYEVLPPPKESDVYSLLNFGRKYFSRPKEAEKSLQHTKTSLTHPLLQIQKPEISKVVLECFKLIQHFMGDAVSKASSDKASAHSLLFQCRKFRSDILLDEVCIYLAKQTTNNKKRTSCMRGWQLFSLFLAYYPCSNLLLPNMLAHLHKISEEKDNEYANGANVCLVNLQQTLEYGGRKQKPSSIEIDALLLGRTSMDQVVLLPGGIQWTFKFTTSSVVKHFISQICMNLDIQNADDMKEYAIFKLSIDDKANVTQIIPLLRNTYLFDVYHDMVVDKVPYTLMFQRIVWKNQINFEHNEKVVKLLFNQFVPEYNDGKLLTYRELTEGLTKAQIGEIVKMCALILRGYDGSSLPSQEEVLNNIPKKILHYQSNNLWRDEAHNEFAKVQQQSPHDARSEVLGMLMRKKMFGASFFTVEVMNSDGQPLTKMIAINAQNVFIFDPENHYIEKEYALGTISAAEFDLNEQIPICKITIDNPHTNQREILMLKTKKALVINGVINQHIHVAK